MNTTPAPEREVTYSAPEMDATARLRELIIYISARSINDRMYGVTKLNKILWWADLWAFGVHQRPITGATYVRLPQGPVPDGIDMLRSEMEENRDIAISPVEHYGRVRHRVIALRKANLSMFSGEEIAIVDMVIQDSDGLNATNVSKRSHGRMWDALPHRHRMPYESVFISEAKPTRADVARTKQLNSQYGWE
jgi:Protein of unknown function (DUF4065)